MNERLGAWPADTPGPRSSHRRRMPRWVIAYWQQTPAMLGLGIVLALLLMALLAWEIAPYHPKRGVAAALSAPSPAHWFGVDDLGRDVLSNVIHGSRSSLLVGLGVALQCLVIGTVIGLSSGYLGGVWDDLLMRLTEAVQLMPRFFLVLLLATLFGHSLLWMTVLLGLTSWPPVARLVRAQVLSLRQHEFVVAARAVGARGGRIMVRHILPNGIGPVIVTSASQVAGAILAEAGLSFLGLGDPTLVSWGQMLSSAQGFVRVAWWLSFFPGSALALTVLASTLIADGLIEALNAGT